MKAKITDHYITTSENYINAHIVFQTTDSKTYVLESAFKKGEAPNEFLEVALKECSSSDAPITALSVIQLSKSVEENILELNTEFDIRLNQREQVSRVKKRSNFDSLVETFSN